nr:unnamed protein product [Spirometra erinaceieuropaei]
MLNCVGKRVTRTSTDASRDPKPLSPNLERHNPPPPPRTHTARHPAPMSSNVLQRTSSHQVETANSVTNIGSLPTDRVPNQQGKLLEIVQARAIVSFHDTTFRSSLSFLKDEIICVFVDSMASSTGYTPASHPTSLSAPWWRGFRAADGPGTTGFFPSSSVALLHTACPIPSSLPLQSSANPAPQVGGAGPRKRADLVDFAIQTDSLSFHDNSSCTSTGSVDAEEDGQEDFPDDCTEDRSASTGNEAVLQVEAVVLREIEALADTARLVPMTSAPSSGGGFKSTAATSMSSSSFPQRTTQAPSASEKLPLSLITGTGTNSLSYGTASLESSNRNSSTSLDSGRGSAYATSSSEGGKHVTNMAVCSHCPLPRQRIRSPPTDFTPLPYAVAAAEHVDPNPVTRVSPRHICTWGGGGGGGIGTDQPPPPPPAALPWSGARAVGDMMTHPCRSPTHSSSSPASSTSGASYLAESRRLRLQQQHPGPTFLRSPPSVVPPSAPQWNSRTSCSSAASNASSIGSSESSGSSCSSCCLQTQLAECAATDSSSMELLKNWLSSAGFADYITCLASAGYDLGTLRRATPEDLNACGITNPRDRQQLRNRLARLQLPESLPDNIPPSVCEWLSLLNLDVYWPALQSQGFTTFERISALTWEDLEEVGITKLGHQKKMMLAIERIKKALSARGDNVAVSLELPGPLSSRQADGTQCSNMPASTVGRPGTPQPLSISGSGTDSVPIAGIVASRPSEGHSDIEADLSDAGSTPPPPPAFQDPPVAEDDKEDGSGQTLEDHALHVTNRPHSPHDAPACKTPPPVTFVRKASLDSSVLMHSTIQESVRQPPNLHFSASHLSNLGKSSCPDSPCAGPPTSLTRDGDQSGLPPPKLLPDTYPATVRQRYRSCNTVTIPVPNHVLPPPASGRTTDLEIRDMQELRSTLDKLSQYLTPNGSP